ncbi:MAG: hypothetical protein M0Z61_15645 [Nitrospiraceae bacterium]|nr:hypothetical protein [Nitrospiraceae bacterium]
MITAAGCEDCFPAPVGLHVHAGDHLVFDQQFMLMSGCIVEMKKNRDGWLIKMTGENCNY